MLNTNNLFQYIYSKSRHREYKGGGLKLKNAIRLMKYTVASLLDSLKKISYTVTIVLILSVRKNSDRGSKNSETIALCQFVTPDRYALRISGNIHYVLLGF